MPCWECTCISVWECISVIILKQKKNYNLPFTHSHILISFKEYNEDMNNERDTVATSLGNNSWIFNVYYWKTIAFQHSFKRNHFYFLCLYSSLNSFKRDGRICIIQIFSARNIASCVVFTLYKIIGKILCTILKFL